MKNSIASLLLFFICIPGFSQSFDFEYQGRKNPGITKSTLSNATFIGEIMPELWRYLQLPYKERIELDLILNYFPETSYNRIIDLVSVEIVGFCKGEEVAFKSTSEELTEEQKNMLNTADMGSDLIIRLKFSHKYSASDNVKADIRLGYYSVAIVPEVEAEFPEGNTGITNFIQENIINKVAIDTDLPDFVEFIVDEEGAVTDIQITRREENPEMDQLVLSAFSQMPKWSPAQNAAGEKVKQSFTIPILMVGC